MAITLAEAALATQDAIQAGVIDEFRQASPILEAMPFDDSFTPGTNGGTMTYGYNRVITPAAAAFRDITADYTPSEAKTERKTADLKVFGGKYGIDRVLIGTGGLYDQVAFQASQKVKAATKLFHDAVINGDSGVDSRVFDGLDVAVAGSSTEYGIGAVVDLSTTAAIESNSKAFMDDFDLFLAELDATPDVIAGNRRSIARMSAVARRLGLYASQRDEFGRMVSTVNGIPLVDLGDKPGSSNPIVTLGSRIIAATPYTNVTDLYAIRFGFDAFHGVTLGGRDLVKVILPRVDVADEDADAVKEGAVEMVACVVLKTTKTAGVFRNLRV